jgi:hypothetical protein
MPLGYRITMSAAVLLMSAAASPVSGQVIQGTVRDGSTRAALHDATVVLLDSAGGTIAQHQSDARGAFRFGHRSSRIVYVKVSLFGYEDAVTPPFRAGTDTTLVLDLIPSPVRVDSLRVDAAARSPRLEKTGFYTRQQRGFGSFLTRATIDSAHAIVLTDVLRTIPGVRVVRAGSSVDSFDVVMAGAGTMFIRKSEATPGQPATRTCYPSIVIDGFVVRRGGRNDETGGWVHLVPPGEVEGVEVYSSAAGLPVQVAGRVSPCGSILIWTRQ